MFLTAPEYQNRGGYCRRFLETKKSSETNFEKFIFLARAECGTNQEDANEKKIRNVRKSCYI